MSDTENNTSNDYQFKDKRITVIPYEEVTVEMQRYYNSNGATMIPLKRSRPEPRVSYEPLSPELQIKYNGTLSTLNIIIYKEICIYKHLVAEQEHLCANACILDIDKSISQEALHQLLLSDDQTKSSLFLIGDEYGVDIFNVKRAEVSVEEFKERCAHLAKTLSINHSIPVRVVFAQTLFPHIINCNPKDNLC